MGSSHEGIEHEKKISPKELKELRRVYDKLCYWSDKVKLVLRLKKLKGELQVKRNELFEQINTSTKQSSTGIEQIEKEMLDIQSSLDDIRHRPDQYIRTQDTAAAFKYLGKKVSKREVLDMMWEVDEKLDNVIDWDEFLLMFTRNIHDNTGLEPSAFYHMVQFMIYDRNDNRNVSIDETMNMLYARVGREKMEAMISLLFGDGDQNNVIEHTFVLTSS